MLKTLRSAFYLFFLFILSLNQIASAKPEEDKGIKKTTDDDNTKYTNIGNIGLTITNFGTYGHGFSLWPQQPSCEYPIGSGIEHIFDGGLWIGGFISNSASGSGKTGPFVTTGAVDASSVSSRGGGFEFTNGKGSGITERSSLLDSRYYSPLAVSHQDFVMDFTDTNTTLSNGEVISDHSPLGVTVHLTSYTWNYSFADFFVIMNYWIKNVSGKYIDSACVGLWTDAVVRNTNVTSPRSGSTFFDKGGDGFDDSLNIAYEFDAGGDIGFSDSYVGIQFLGSNAKYDSVNFVSWQFRNTSDPNLFAPQNDYDRYRKLLGYFGGNNRLGAGFNGAALKTKSNRSLLISSGPYRSIAPGDSINVVFAIVCAKTFGNDNPANDTKIQRTNLYNNAGWALRAYNGEDKNGNGILEPSEDLDQDGKITRYILPSPPQSPRVKIVPGDQKIAIYWDRRAETSIDPISSKKDFEGYRLYRTNAAYDLTTAQNLQASLVKMAEFDSLNNSIGFNTGFGAVRLAQPATFENDTTQYFYKYEINNLLNGWQYTYSVTAFDKGDSQNNLESLESSVLGSAKRALPGSLPTSEESVQVGVYPNPYYGNAYWDGDSERLRKIYFFNLPKECEITIYTLAGDIVKKIQHNSQSNGSDIRWFETYAKDGTQIVTGGEHAWDLISDHDQAIATGLYLFSVKDAATGHIKTGKFLVVK